MESTTARKPEVSVIIPAYNCGDFIAQAIESVQQQTLPNLEILVIDDGSTDNTQSRVQKLAAEDDRVRYYRIDNSGSPRARNYGFDLAQGDYIAVLDADDLWPANKLEVQVEALKGKVNAIALGQVQRFSVDADGRHQPGKASQLPSQSGNYVDRLLSLDLEQMVNFNTLLAPRSIIVQDGRWDPAMVTAHDWENWIRLAQRYEFVHIDQVLQFYRKHHSSTTRGNKIDKALHYQLLAIERHAPKGLANLWRRLGYRRKRYQDLIAALNHQGETGAALQLWIKACFHSNIALTRSGIRQLAEIVASSRNPRGASREADNV